jgi:hypothetical protein
MVNKFYHKIKLRVMSARKGMNSFVGFVYLGCIRKSVRVYLVIGLSFQCAVFLMSRLLYTSLLCRACVASILGFVYFFI